MNSLEGVEGMTEPLLDSDVLSSPLSMASSTSWPSEHAKRVKLTPIDEKGEQIHEQLPECSLVYSKDGTNEPELLVVSTSAADGDNDGEDVIVDRILVHDIIGASVEIRPATKSKDGASRDRLSDRAENEPPSDSLRESLGNAILTIFAYPKKARKSGESTLSTVVSWCWSSSSSAKKSPPVGYRHPRHRYFRVAPSEDLSDLQVVVSAIRGLAGPVLKRKALVVINPMSGPQKNANRVYEKIVRPMLTEQTSLFDQVDVLVTAYAGHAKERMMEGDVGGDDEGNYDTLITVGGDGVMHECLQGLLQFGSAKGANGHEILKGIALGTIGAGTSNGFAKSLAVACGEECSHIGQAFMICKGRTTPVDLTKHSAHTTSRNSYLSFLTHSWAMPSDIDLESECLRFLGELRYDVWGVWCVLRMRSYRAKFSYLPPNSEEWIESEDEFYVFWATHVSYVSEGIAIAPHVQFGSGFITIFIVRAPVSRYRMARILLGLEGGSHSNMPGVEFVECTAYKLEPISHGSYSNLDGEHIEPDAPTGAVPLEATIIPAATNLFSVERF